MDTQNSPTISLCVIAGNESAHIERMLESFKDAFDELSLVIACGSIEPDDTLELARTWATLAGKGFVASAYLNAPDCKEWPHVDDFAAARNQSFDQATGQWLLWADCDDVLDGADAVRAACGMGLDMVRFPYNVQEAGKTTVRERLFRTSRARDGWRWRGVVHEGISVLPSDKWGTLTTATWLHSPAGPKAGGNRRNLRILTGKVAESPVDYFYIHQEWFYLKKPIVARRFGELFLSMPNAPDVLRYQALLNMVEMEDMHEKAYAFAMRAWFLFPHAREAVSYVVRCAMQAEKPEQALYFAGLMADLPEPAIEHRHWWHEPRWYGWAGDDLLARAHRYAGDHIGAGMMQHKFYGGFAPPQISLIHATRGRCSQAIICRDQWLQAADNPRAVEHIFAIDHDDEEGERWLKQFVRTRDGKGNPVSAWNAGAAMATADILIQLSDDWVPPRGWDTALLAECADSDPRVEPFVIAVSDGHRTDDTLCMAIMSRARYEQQGEQMFSPEYDSMYSDNEFSYRAFRDHVVIDARNRIEFTHMHPAHGSAAMDETYARTNAPERYEAGKATFLRRNPEATL